MISSLLVTLGVVAAFPTPVNTERNRETPLMAPAEAARRMRLPPDFSATVFAAEPDVQNPIAMAWDARGRLWVAENYTYSQRSQRFDLSLRDRVLIFDDRNQDGVADRRTVFTDEVQMLTSIEVGLGGLWLMCPPHLIYLPDRDGDDQPDGPAEIKLDGFTVAEANHHNFANGLRFGPDGWLYGRCGGACPARIGPPGCPAEQRMTLEGGIWRYHPSLERVEVLTTGTTNPWGHDWNQLYEGFFVNTVNGHLWHLIPGSHLVRPFTLDPNPHTYRLIDLHADHWHFDTGKPWQDSRDGAANEFGGGHAHSGTSIYLGGLWPRKFHGRLFTLNFHGRRINQERLDRHESGYLGRHEPDFLISADPWFRGIDLRYGPDGNMFVLDWSDTGECHEATGVHRTSGRIYKIAYQRPSQANARQPTSRLGSERSTARDLTQQTDQELARMHRARNEWFVRQARLELTRRAARRSLRAKAVQYLHRMVNRQSNDTVDRLRAGATLFCIGQLNSQQIDALLSDPDPHLRAWAVRWMTDKWPLDDAVRPAINRVVSSQSDRSAEVRDQQVRVAERLADRAKADNSGLVRLAIASALQRFQIDLRPRIATALVTHAADKDDHNLPLMVWYGLIPVAPRYPVVLADIAGPCQWPQTRRLIARRLGELIHVHPAGVDRLVRLVLESSDATFTADVLTGLQLGLKGYRQAEAPQRWSELIERFDDDRYPELASLARRLSVVFGDGRALKELGRVATDPEADVALRQSALRTLIAQQSPRLRQTCLTLLNDQRMNVLAARGLALFAGRKIGDELVAHYQRVRSPFRPQIISILVSRPEFARALLDGIEKEIISREHLTAFDVRQIHSLGNSELSQRVSRLWGEVRETSEDKAQAIAELKSTLQPAALARADKSVGRTLFEKHCAQCHRLYGEGHLVGPDLTGANRNDLDYLLENIVAPSAVVGKDYRMSILELADGRVLNGLVVTENDATVTLQTQTDRVTVPRQDIQHRTVTDRSPMPDGILEPLTDDQIKALIAYLKHPVQVPRAAVRSQ